MNTPGIGRRGRLLPPSVGMLSLQLLSWWCAFYLALVLLALAEGVVLRHMGVEYHPESSLRHVSVRSFSVSTDGRWAAQRLGFTRWSSDAVTSEEVVLHDLRRQTVTPLHLCHLEPRCVAITPTAERVAIACQDGAIYLWSRPVRSAASGVGTLDGKLHLLYRARGLGITRLVFSPDGQQLAAVGKRHIHLLRIPAEGIGGPAALLHRWPCGGKAISVAFSDDARSLVVFGFDGELRRYDSQGGQLVGSKNGAVHTALSPDGRLVAYMFANGRMSMWDLAADRELWHSDIAGYCHKVSHDNAPDVMGFSPDGRVLATACWADQTVWILCYDANTGACLGKSPRYKATFKGLVVAADHFVYFWDTDGVIRAWQAGQDHELWRFSWPLETSSSTSLVSTIGR